MFFFLQPVFRRDMRVSVVNAFRIFANKCEELINRLDLIRDEVAVDSRRRNRQFNILVALLAGSVSLNVWREIYSLLAMVCPPDQADDAYMVWRNASMGVDVNNGIQ